MRVSPAWLELREPADARARSTGLVDRLRRHLPHGGTTVVHDLGSATGSMTRWLAPRLDGPQHWVLHDRDEHLLARAADALPTAADGSAVTIETRLGDITRLGPAGLAGASLVTASALLDMLTADELDRLVTSCSEAGCPVLLTLSVIGRVELAPADPLDATLGDRVRRPPATACRGRVAARAGCRPPRRRPLPRPRSRRHRPAEPVAPGCEHRVPRRRVAGGLGRRRPRAAPRAGGRMHGIPGTSSGRPRRGSPPGHRAPRRPARTPGRPP